MNSPVAVKLADICDIRSGGTPSRTNPRFYGGSIPWAKISDLETRTGSVEETEETITEAGLAAISGRLFKPGTLLFAIYGSIGKMAFANRHLATNQAILGISVRDEERVDRRFLYHWLAYRKDALLSDGQGIAQKNLSAAYLRDLLVPLPPLDEQRRLAAILDKADALRRRRKRALDLLDGLTQSIFREMFGSDNLSDPGPEQISLGEIASVKSGYAFRSADFSETGIPIVRISDLRNTTVSLENSVRINPINIENGKNYTVTSGDILIAMSGATTGKIGVVPMGLKEVALLNQRVGKFQILREDVVNRYFLIGLIQSKKYQTHIENLSWGAAQPNVSGKQLESYRLKLPSVERQKMFGDRVLALENIHGRAKSESELSHFLFATLQSRAFSGQL